MVLLSVLLLSWQNYVNQAEKTKYLVFVYHQFYLITVTSNELLAV